MASESKKLAELNRNRIDLGRSPPAAFKRVKEDVMALGVHRFMVVIRGCDPKAH
jgi:hypothetical protein